MCDPFTIAGIAASAGSMLVNNMAQGRVNKAREGAMEAERIRQRGLDDQAAALNTQSQDRFTNFEGDQNQKTGDLTEFFKSQNQAIPTEGAPTETVPASSNNLVVQEQKKQAGKAKAFGDQQASALGALRAFGDVLGDKSRLQARDASLVGQIGGFKRGSSAVLPLELEAANNKGAGLRMFGDILGLGGSLGMGYGTSTNNYNLFTKPIQGPLMPGQTRPIVNRLTGNVINAY